MIYVKRTKTVPAIANSSPLVTLRESLRDFYTKRSAQSRLQEKPVYITLSSKVLSEITKELLKEFNGKCAYCETPIDNKKAWGLIDHFRPKSSAKGKKDVAKQHYWWLAYTWKNMYLSCPVCNKYKSSWFPVKGSRAALETSFEKIILQEDNLLIDPCKDAPDEHLVFREDGKVEGFTEWGEMTVELLQLNRNDLVKKRAAAVKKLSELISGFTETWGLPDSHGYVNVARSTEELCKLIIRINTECQSMPYAAPQTGLLDRWLYSNPNIAAFIFENKKPKYYSKKIAAVLTKYRKELQLSRKGITPEKKILKASPETTKKAKQANPLTVQEKQVGYLFPAKENTAGSRASMYNQSKKVLSRIFMERIEIKNFKAISELTIYFPKSDTKQEGWLMLLGENGVGKSTFLQAMALTLAGKSYLDKLHKLGVNAADVLKHGEKSGYVKIFLEDNDSPLTIEFNTENKKIRSSVTTSFAYLLGYGSTRLFPSKKIKPESGRGRVRLMNLFDPGVGLTDARKWLLETDIKKYSQAAIALKDLLLLDTKNILVKKDNNIFVQYEDGEFDELGELSDGYKSIIAVTVDIMKTFMPAETNSNIRSTMEDAEGIVLLDEIGTHLHPRWRMKVVESFRRAFPRLQFIVTTHDPLCLRGIGKGEVVVFQKDEKRVIRIITDLPDPREFKVEQLLKSEFFGLNSTNDPEIESSFNSYYDLLSREKSLNKEEKDELNRLKIDLKNKEHLGQSRREELAYKVIDKALAGKKNVEEIIQSNAIMEETVAEVKKLWDED
jgi:uncharacterized protein (TIGR02646 family)